MTKITDKKIDFNKIFSNFINKKSEPNLTQTRVSWDDDWDDYPYGDYYDNWGYLENDNDYYWDSNSGKFYKREHKKEKKSKEAIDDYDSTEEFKQGCKNNKRGCRGSKKNKNNSDETDDEEYKVLNEAKVIYFYPNIYMKNIRNEYNTLQELNDYMVENNIETNVVSTKYLINHYEIHCGTYTDRFGQQILVTSPNWDRLKEDIKECEDMCDSVDWD